MIEDNCDIFISHASEDKDELVRPLAIALTNLGFSIWYDEFTLVPGDSLYESIEKGLSKSSLGVVVLSEAFFQKKWTKTELSGLFSKKISSGARIIPVWHNINHETLVAHAPMISDILGLQSNIGIAGLARSIGRVLRPDSHITDIVNMAQSVSLAERLCADGNFSRAVIELWDTINFDPESYTIEIRRILENARLMYVSALIKVGNCKDAIDFIGINFFQKRQSLYSSSGLLIIDILKYKASCILAGECLAPECIHKLANARRTIPFDTYFDPCFAATNFLNAHQFTDISSILLDYIYESALSGDSARHRELEAYTLKDKAVIARNAKKFLEAIEISDLMINKFMFSNSREIQTALAWVYLGKQRTLHAMKCFHSSIEYSLEIEKLFISDEIVSNVIAWSIAERGISLRCASEYEAAIRANKNYLRRYFQLSSNFLHLEITAIVLGEIVFCYRKLRNYSKALEACDTAMEFCKNYSDIEVVYELAWNQEEKARIYVEMDMLNEALQLRQILTREYSSFTQERFVKLIARCHHAIGFIRILQIKRMVKNGLLICDLAEELREAENSLLIANVKNISYHTYGSLGYICFLRMDMLGAVKHLKMAYELGGNEWLQEECTDTERCTIEIDREFIQLLERITQIECSNTSAVV